MKLVECRVLCGYLLPVLWGITCCSSSKGYHHIHSTPDHIQEPNPFIYSILHSITRNSGYWCKRIFLGQQQWMKEIDLTISLDKLVVWFCHNAKLRFTTTDSYGQHAMQKTIQYFYYLQKQNFKIKVTEYAKLNKIRNKQLFSTSHDKEGGRPPSAANCKQI